MHEERAEARELPVTGNRHKHRTGWDLGICLVLAGIAAAAAFWMPAESPFRLVLGLPVLVFVPGYLLLQALMVPRKASLPRWVEALLAIPVSPAVVGLLALATWIIPGGFTPRMIIGVVTGACFLLGAIALQRRQAPTPERRPGRGQLKRPDHDREHG